MKASAVFKLHDFLYLQGGAHPFVLDDRIPLSEQILCPADGKTLKTLCTFVGENGTRRMRYGCCDVCGYQGYIDRPTKAWISHFYFEMWEKDEGALIPDNEIKKLRDAFVATQNIKSEGTKKFLTVIEGIHANKDRYVCEIGSGVGTDLKMLQSIGFERVVGTENSTRRATIAHKLHGIEVIAGPFEDAGVQTALLKKSPFSLIFSRHVLEHVYDPAEIIRNAARLQDEGDSIVLIMPNGLKEAPMTRLLFLPHLHSYSTDTVVRMLHKHGYELQEDFSDDEEIFVVARKTLHPKLPSGNGAGRFDDIAKKMIADLHISEWHLKSKRRLWWGKNFGPTWQSLFFSHSYIDRLYFKVILKLVQLRMGEQIKFHAISIGDCSKRCTSRTESPLEIQFNGPIRLVYK